MATPTLDRFLKETFEILRQKDGQKLQKYLILEPPYPDIYLGMIRELKQVYLPNKINQLENKLEKLLPDYEFDPNDSGDGGAWNGFRTFLVSWLEFISNIDVTNILKTHNDLIVILRQSQIALGDNTMGVVVLPTVLFYAHTLAKFTMFLEKQPELLVKAQQQMREDESGAGNDEDSQVTLASTTARVIIEALKKCINERLSLANGGLDANGKPAGRRVGIYVLANICLKLLTRARQFRTAETLFTQIRQLSPPLSRFPAGQRVTYLYYLGRYHFSNNHFLRASTALQAAYGQSRKQDVTQRYHILIYLIAANIIVGKLPSQQLFSRPEALPLVHHFQPFAKAIRSGDLLTFRRLTCIDSIDTTGSTARFFLIHGILLQLRNRGEVLVMRSLARRVFKEAGFHGSEGSKAAPNMDIPVLRSVIVRLEQRAATMEKQTVPGYIDLDSYVDPDFDGLDEEDLNYLPYAVYDEDADDNSPGAEDNNNADQPPARSVPTMPEVEILAASMVRQGLLHGFISHKHAKFVVSGAKNRDPIEVGFPQVWNVMKAKRENDVIGWVTDENRGQMRRGGVVRLSGVQPVGVAG